MVNEEKKIKYIEYQKAYRERNKDKMKEYQKKYREDNSEIKKEKAKEYYLNNKEKLTTKQNQYRLDNLDKIKDYRKEKKDKINEYQRKYRSNNKEFFMCRDLLSNTFNRIGLKKEGKTVDLLGYSPLDLKKHLESLFTDGMTWDNYGEWHIDHIKSVSSFDKNTPVNIINTLRNLQPLWATTREINGVVYEGNLNKQ